MNGQLDFVAVDVETANADLSSICQIGVATVRQGKVENVWSSLINPVDFFASINTSLHGIRESDIQGAPRFRDVFGKIDQLLSGPVFSHMAFDRLAITRACEKCGNSLSAPIWLDSAQVARRAWPDKYAKKGYRLADIAGDLGIEFRHHDAAEDARVAAEIVIRACSQTSLDVDGWIKRVAQPISSSPVASQRITRQGNADGPLFGEIVVFSGGFATSKSQEADIAALAGCDVGSSVTKKTTLLVVGDARYACQEKSSKWQKAESLIEQGHPIRILCESDFRKLLSQN